ncbi:lytic transglycosylase domain-containing protein [Evansella cellulosilytica]|uniref:Lytic transglycosylase catalytic n=1 Tax=Evansella cellulosilytica (strain ATCC 21833 / DSM 2522 / FERM P-1141 / JCM 9156 / N-4) TaxID=649639 RepID=E6TW84_EVAC2|nr:transglycosylase SLT domain-containing protein [Evansella cellulosilytica]ADU31040.1 Lytic transglycosylase catalytic [Evansella cellulosilytica DSM 2522]
MRMKSIGIILSSLFMIVSIIIIISVEFKKMKDSIDLAEAENRLMKTENETLLSLTEDLNRKRDTEKEKFEEALQLERIIAYVESEEGSEYDDVAHYISWEMANEFADYFYEDSGGLFKKDWGKFLALAASEKDIDPLIIYELLRVETGGTFNPETIGPQTRYGRAHGLAQFMKNTSPWIADMANLPYNHDMLYDPLYSIELAVTYLDFLYSQYGDWDHALTAYHRGIGGMQNYIERNGHARSWYAVEIQEAAAESKAVAMNIE